MKKPVIKDKAILQYVEYLEAKVNSDSTKMKFFKGVQRQLDLLADEMLNDEFKISLKGEGTEFKNFADMLIKGNQIIQSMKNFENEAMPKQDEKKVNTGTADEFITSRV